MTAIDVCLCVLIVAGAFALICLGIVFIKLLSTLEQANQSMIEAQKTIERANLTLDDVNYKLDLLNAPFEKVNGIFSSGSRPNLLGKTAGIVGAYRAGKKKNKKERMNQMKLGKLIVGIGIGTVIGMLIAPKKGSELVDDINTKVKDAKDYAKDLKKEDVIAKFNDTVASVSKAVSEFDAEKYKETTKQKLEDLGKEVEKLKNKIVESEQFNSLVGTFNHIANTVNDKVDDILDELTDELAEAEMAEDNHEIDIEEEIDDTAKEIEELIQEMNADSENKG